MIAAGLFYSKISYCLSLFVNTWGLDTYRVGGTRFSSFTKEDIRRMQVLQNKVARLLIGNKYSMKQKNLNMSTEELLHKSGDLSVHQLGALQTVVMTKKIILSQKPSYLAQRLQIRQDRGPGLASTIQQKKTKLGIYREGFVYRGAQLFNMLPLQLREETNMNKFKKNVKSWIKSTVAVKP